MVAASGLPTSTTDRGLTLPHQQSRYCDVNKPVEPPHTRQNAPSIVGLVTVRWLTALTGHGIVGSALRYRRDTSYVPVNHENPDEVGRFDRPKPVGPPTGM